MTEGLRDASFHSLLESFWLLAALLWLLLVGVFVHAGFQPDDYRPSHSEALILPYPMASIAEYTAGQFL
ncbi:hypothetical protein DBR33_03335 [Stenotrophomonas sp. HMWF022]|nr:hypothetical protein DBR20_15915 [Stenotrophomonas sp. HMWF023]PTT55523.1 hypothetical protein DBR33_03335 [Stenotrophomonas sp. HMWF022]